MTSHVKPTCHTVLFGEFRVSAVCRRGTETPNRPESTGQAWTSKSTWTWVTPIPTVVGFGTGRSRTFYRVHTPIITCDQWSNLYTTVVSDLYQVGRLPYPWSKTLVYRGVPRKVLRRHLWSSEDTGSTPSALVEKTSWHTQSVSDRSGPSSRPVFGEGDYPSGRTFMSPHPKLRGETSGSGSRDLPWSPLPTGVGLRNIAGSMYHYNPFFP